MNMQKFLLKGPIIFLMVFLFFSAEASSKPNYVPVLGAMNAGDFKLAVQALEQETPDALGLYLLAVSYSRLGNARRTFEHAAAAILASEKIDKKYADGAILLTRWAAFELSRPKKNLLKYEDVLPETDVAKLAAIAKEAADWAKEFEKLKEQLKPVIDVQMEINAEKIANQCWDPNVPETDVCMFENRSAPTVPFPR